MTAVRLLTYVATDEGYVRRSGKHTPPVVVQPGIADAGALPLGQASYDIPAGAVFVAPGGSDSATGTKAGPLRTLTKAIAMAPSGGTVVMRAGTYNDGSDTQNKTYPYGVIVGKALTIQNYPGETVWFDGSIPVPGSWTASGGLWSTPYDRIFNRGSNLVMGAAPDPRPGWDWYNADHPEASWPDMVWIDGTQLAAVTSKAQVGPGKFFIEGTDLGSNWFAGSKLWIGDDPAGREVRYANKAKFLTAAGAPDLTIRGVGIRRYATSMPTMGAIYLNEKSPRPTFENVIMEDFPAMALFAGGSLDLHMTKVTVQRVGSEGVNTNQVDRLIVDRCVFDSTDNRPFAFISTGAGAIKMCKQQGGTIKDTVFRNNKKGFWTDQSVYGLYIYNCLFEGSYRQGLEYELSGDAIVANCKFVNSGEFHMIIHNTDQARLWNNTMVNIGDDVIPLPAGTNLQHRAVCFRQDDRRPNNTSYGLDPRNPQSFYDQPQNQWQINNMEMSNNIVAHVGTNVQCVLAIDDLERNTGNARLLGAYHPSVRSNVYQWSQKPQYPWITPDITTSGSGVQIFQSLTAVQNGTGMEQGSRFFTDDPLDANYNLKDATIHDGAMPLPADIAALIGQPAGTRHVGCFW